MFIDVSVVSILLSCACFVQHVPCLI